MNKKLIYFKALFMILLVLVIPIYISEFSSAQAELKDPAGACIDKADETSALVEFFDNDLLNTLNGIFRILHFLCTTMTAIDTFLNNIYTLYCSTYVARILSFGASEGFCAEKVGTFSIWKFAFKGIHQPLCCMVTCGWCTGGNCGGIFGAALGEIDTKGVFGAPGAKNLMGQLGIGPYDNIYTSIGCLCLPGILFNMRKLTVIYKTYECCVQEACKNGMSTEGCEQSFDEQICMYWQGSILQTLVKIIITIVAGLITKLLVQLGLQALWLNDIIALWDLIETPKTVEGLIDSFKMATESFDSPKCSDLGFDEIKEANERQFLNPISDPGNVYICNDGRTVTNAGDCLEYYITGGAVFDTSNAIIPRASDLVKMNEYKSGDYLVEEYGDSVFVQMRKYYAYDYTGILSLQKTEYDLDKDGVVDLVE